MKIGEVIRQRRVELGMSQEELAERCGFKSKSTISKLESGQRETTTKNLLKIAQVLGIDPGALFVPQEAWTTLADSDIGVVVEILHKHPGITPLLLQYARYLASQEGAHKNDEKVHHVPEKVPD